ncbi:uncharacterized protein [Coffea arabica]|uniref:Uncharacterized protein n=1 Tax=Coffea arabica TaxID=13443 RepID=A0A6P6VCH1_COFAR|nr:uncharacterized protein LOC113719299 [Coffea arabica]
MESRDKVKLLQTAIKQLIEEAKVRNADGPSLDESFVAVSGDKDGSPDDDDDRRLLLSKLLSQLDALQEDGMLEEPKASADNSKVPNPEAEAEAGEKSETANEARKGDSSSEIGKEDIIKELNEVKRQNFITHCLLSAMIVLTVAWQLSQVSLILKVKEGLSHPFKSLGGMITGLLKGNRRITGQEVDKLASSVMPKPILAASSLPDLKIPELPRVELPVFDVDNEE